MPHYEFRVVPAPRRAEKAKGVKGSEAQFAHTLQTLMNQLGADGWDYVRADCLPCEERQGLTGRTTTFQNVLVFRRALDVEARDMPAAPPPVIAAPAPAPAVEGPKVGTAPALGPAMPLGPEVAEEETSDAEPDPETIGRTLTATRD